MPNETQGRITDRPQAPPPAPLSVSAVDGKAPAGPPPLHDATGRLVNEAARATAAARQEKPHANE